MAADKKEKKDKKDRKEKKHKETKLASDDGGKVKKEKKDKKKEKKEKAKLAAALDAHLQSDVAGQVDGNNKQKKTVVKLSEADGTPVTEVPAILVPFAVPLVEDKDLKRVIRMVRRGKLPLHPRPIHLRNVRRNVHSLGVTERKRDGIIVRNQSYTDMFPPFQTAAKANVLKRGVKEVVKALRKSPLATPTSRSFDGVVVIAGDISPPDVISHLPVLCEDHGVPYVFISRRAELGAAARTKRPTSVVMIMEKSEAKAKGADGKTVKTKQDVTEVEEDDDGKDGDYAEGYKELVKVVQRETGVQAHWIKA